jgi:hypothetical protein
LYKTSRHKNEPKNILEIKIKVQHDFSEVKICVRIRFPFDSRFNGRPIFFASKHFLCSFCTFKPLVLAVITLNVVLAQSDLEFFVWSTSFLMSSFSNRMQKSRVIQSVKQALPTTHKKRVAVMASYLDNKHSPTVKSLIYMGCFENCFGPIRTRFMSFVLP